MFRASLCPSSGAQEYFTVVAACGIWCCGFQVVGCRMLPRQHPANRTHNPQLHTRPTGSTLQTGHITLSSANHSTKYHRQQLLYNTLELLMMGIVVPETC